MTSRAFKRVHLALMSNPSVSLPYWLQHVWVSAHSPAGPFATHLSGPIWPLCGFVAPGSGVLGGQRSAKFDDPSTGSVGVERLLCVEGVGLNHSSFRTTPLAASV